MSAEERKKLVDFIVWATEVIEGVKVDPAHIDYMYDDEKLRKEADWYDYLLDK